MTPDDHNGLLLPLVEEFYSVQGEGANTGKAAYFIRVGGCDICCNWCDTKYSWNAELHPLVTVEEITDNVVRSGAVAAVVTGGEPLTWNMGPLCRSLKRHGITTFLETSGAYPLTGEWDWITLSPKRSSPPLPDIVKRADELKVVIQDNSDFEEAEKYSREAGEACVLYLQPEWSRYREMVAAITEYVKRNTRWRVSLQAQKFMHIP